MTRGESSTKTFNGHVICINYLWAHCTTVRGPRWIDKGNILSRVRQT